MVFSSIEFIYLFLPPVLLGFLVLRWLRLETGIIAWLVLASIAFYAWWSVAYLALLGGSVVFNYGLHRLMQRWRRKWLLVCGIAANLALLGWFKYADFLIENLNAVAGAGDCAEFCA
jgi:alginate O-acetyltransferase complex protein AlgI